MCEDHTTPASPDRPDQPIYAPAILVDAGDVVELTNGATSYDTADR